MNQQMNLKKWQVHTFYILIPNKYQQIPNDSAVDPPRFRNRVITAGDLVVKVDLHLATIRKKISVSEGGALMKESPYNKYNKYTNITI